MPSGADHSTLYDPTIGLLCVFNLIVGTGALALPKAFQTAGYVLSIVVLVISCTVSYISATFVVEALSVGNAVNVRKRREETQASEFDDVVISESGPSSFEINEKIELSQMASMFLGRCGVVFSHLALNIYLFGDLTIYSTTVPKSLMNIICAPVNTSTVLPSDNCRDNWPAFFSRFMAFILMIVLASAQMITNGVPGTPPAVNVHGFGSLFGVAVYAFMCHHSLPSLITPMSSKSGVFAKLLCVYVLVISFYFTLSLTGSFAFANVQDVYTLNFLHDDFTSLFYFICDHFLAMFPVFTLTTNYPIVGITLINNMRVVRDMVWDMVMPTSSRVLSEEESLLHDDDQHDSGLRRNTRYDCISLQPYDIMVPVFAIALPTTVSLMTDDVLLLATVTGCYPGVVVQFLIPCLLVMRSRTYAKSVLNFPVPKRYASPFQSSYWPYAIFVWSAFAVIMVTLNILGFRF
ncbi:unnamed protein product [Angiostrongylus costaricensis]|uniref:Aa_trans domain-containing protein n=1 Tax=Angiostrongylus costaricensis TaxID=334426 RepID=A0A0R3PSB2_ANGCS|nr:unnamed protein product [Angiostrongylus costaricensis]